MQRPLRFLLIATVCFLSVPWGNAALGQSLQVLDPQQPWYRAHGTIEEAIVTVEPKGIYMEYGLYLTFSAKQTGFTPTDTLEVEFFFTLPEDAIVTDSWLWFNGEILRADIMDVWTARDIYEDIVERNQDPSILYKHSARDYELRIFPMAGDQSRRVKLTYLVPAQWNAEAVQAALPTQMLRASAYPIDLRVLTTPDERWKDPRIAEEAGLAFAETDMGDLLLDIGWNRLDTPLSLAFDAPLKDGVFVGTTSYDDEDWYQVAVVPSDDGLAPPRRLAVLFDYDPTKTTMSQADLLDRVEAQLLAALGPKDYFNLVFTRLNTQVASAAWLPADDATIAQSFDALRANPFSNYSNLPALLTRGVDYVTDAADEGQLLLVASSDQFGDQQVANELLRELRDAFGTLPPISVVDVVDRNYQWYNVGGRSFQANEYLYANLAQLTGGTYLHVRDGQPLSQQLARGFAALEGFIHAFDLYTTLENGFCYGRFTSTQGAHNVYYGEAVWQVGKCFGEPPFFVEASGLFEGQPFSQRVRVKAEDIIATDTTLASYWTGQQIRLLEQEPATSEVIAQIIEYSLAARVLSRYTAFIALEPSQGGEVCTTCEDESDGNPTDVEDEVPRPEETTLEAYPNPFSTQVTVAVTLAEGAEASDLKVQIYNAMGQLVRTLRLSQAGFVQAFEIVWDGTNDAGQQVANGTYFLVVQTPTGQHTIALTLIR